MCLHPQGREQSGEGSHHIPGAAETLQPQSRSSAQTETVTGMSVGRSWHPRWQHGDSLEETEPRLLPFPSLSHRLKAVAGVKVTDYSYGGTTGMALNAQKQQEKSTKTVTQNRRNREKQCSHRSPRNPPPAHDCRANEHTHVLAKQGPGLD